MEFEVHLAGAWHRCATVELLDQAQSSRNGPVRLQYEADYAIERLDARDHRALTVHAPVNLRTRDLAHWPSFLDRLPEVMQVCGVADPIIAERRSEIARLARDLRALRDF